MDDTQKVVEPATDLSKALSAIPVLNSQPTPATATPETLVNSSEGKAKKARAPKRVASLMIGQWVSMPNGSPNFFPAKLQPTGTAQREISALTAWLRKKETIEALLAEGLNTVEVVRKELITASFAATTVVKASVK